MGLRILHEMRDLIDRFQFDAMAGVPAHLQDGLRRYIVHGRPPGHFLEAVLANDLFEAVSRADDASLAGLVPLVKYLYNHAPSGCHGNRRALTDWITKGGLMGREVRA